MSADLLTADELAARLHLRPSTLRAWGRKGKIPTVRLSPKVVRYDLATVIGTLARSPDSTASPETLIARIVEAQRAEWEAQCKLLGLGIKLCFASELARPEEVDHA